ncbi:AfsR/SARP family transcriptional regulator [Actinorugispora endophytica]|uniref:AfsR/SARP family transcriptional regulator n=1 Tax=Actinorugispora endophytica TaxID=1605990 RepID=UPI001FB68B8D|nr:AfsR/SARP family transcriptional regulator [Actinorugispora endophytica]
MLGQLTVQVADTPIQIQGKKRRALLATLLLRANSTVPVAELVERMWGGGDAEAHRGALQVHVVRLRALLSEGGGPSPIISEPQGYRIELAEHQLDLSRFRVLVRAAEDADRDGDLPGEAQALDQGLRLWRGPVLADVVSPSLHEVDVPQATERLLAAVERCARIESALGRHERVVARLSALNGYFPHRETLVEQLMLALYRCGRQSDALKVYERTRHVLAEGLGIDPAPSLQHAFHGILRGDLARSAPPRRSAPAQLPPDITHFTGRAGQLAALHSLASADGDRPRCALLSGRPGSGCSALAVRWAHRAAAKFPDGQLYADLGGTGGTARASADVLGFFLRAFGAGEGAPAATDERAALLRSVLARRRALIVLDNARSADQVRPLLPGTPGCAVVVTSRFWLADLIARDGAVALEVDALTEEEATALLIGLLGAARVAAEPRAVALLLEVTERLPLPLRTAAAWLVTHRGEAVRAVVERAAAVSAADPVERMRRALRGDPRFVLDERSR